jgi:hypothetical protein
LLTKYEKSAFNENEYLQGIEVWICGHPYLAVQAAYAECILIRVVLALMTFHVVVLAKTRKLKHLNIGHVYA